jgi:hypothetical protein
MVRPQTAQLAYAKNCFMCEENFHELQGIGPRGKLMKKIELKMMARVHPKLDLTSISFWETDTTASVMSIQLLPLLPNS